MLPHLYPVLLLHPLRSTPIAPVGFYPRAISDLREPTLTSLLIEFTYRAHSTTQHRPNPPVQRGGRQFWSWLRWRWPTLRVKGPA
jgi:hypothetical protein